MFKKFDFYKLDKIFKPLPKLENYFYNKIDEKEIEGFDIETYNGNVFLICSSTKYLYNINMSFDEIIDFLFKNGKKINFFYNIKYDLNAILKLYFITLNCGKIEMLNILNQKKIITQKYIIVYGNKFFKITSIKRKKTKYFFDIYQFYNSSLDDASKKYLNEEKINLDIEKDKLIFFDQKKVIEYCLKDAFLTKQLAVKFILILSKIFDNKIPKKYYSKAYFSYLYIYYKIKDFRTKILPNNIPSAILKILVDYSFKSYHGGIFEAFYKGRLGKCKQYDINSAYPFFIRLIPNFSKGIFVYKFNFTKKDYQKLDNLSKIWAIFHIKAKYNGFMPYQSKKLNKVIYPLTNYRYENWITGVELKNLDLNEIEFIDAIYFKKVSKEKMDYPFWYLINELYTLKEKSRNDKLLYLLYKIILNGIYGKFIQYKYNISYMFNPLIGTLITAFTRVYITKIGKKYFTKVYTISTDSIIGIEKENIKQIVNKKLGGLKLEKEYNNLYIYQIGVYKDNEYFIKTRGFEHSNNVYEKDNKLYVKMKTTLSLPSGIIQNRLNDVCKIVDVEKIIDFKNDFKRNYVKCEDYYIGIEYSDFDNYIWLDEEEEMEKIQFVEISKIVYK